MGVKTHLSAGNMYTFKIIYIYPHSYVESENIALIYARMVFPTVHMSLRNDFYDTYL